MLAEDYSANKTYSIGDYVIYNNELYTCIYGITAPEGWNSAHWKITNLGDGISDLNNAISILRKQIIPNINYVIGGITSQGSINSSYKYCIRPDGQAYLTPVAGTIECDSGYQIRVVKYSAINMGASVFVSDSGWTTTPVAISANEYIAPQIRFENDTTTVLTDTSISEHIVYNLYELNIEDGSIDTNKLSVNLQTDIADTKNDVEQLKTILRTPINLDIDWVIGGITSQGGLNSSFKYCIRPAGQASLIPTDGSIGCDEGYQIRIVKYNAINMGASVFVSDSGWTTTPVEVFENEYVAPQIRYANDTTTVLTDTSISEHIVYNLYELSMYINEQAGIQSDYRHAFFDTNLHFGVWYGGLNPTYDVATMVGRDITGRDGLTSDIINLYDGLVAEYPDYITKTDLGIASGSDLGGNQCHLYEYAFVPIDATYNKHPKKRPTVMLDAGMHGFEKAAVYGLYCFMYDVCHNWDKNDALKNVRFGVNVRIIPVSCPYGFDRNDRLNANHINLNRNFDTPTWQAVPASETGGVWDSNASGLAPFDQPETVIIRDWYTNNKKSCLSYINLHTNGQYNVSSYYEANACIAIGDIDDDYYNRIQTIFRKHICEQTLMWTKEWDNISPSTTIGRFQNQDSTNPKFGTIQQWFGYTVKQIGICLEGFNGMNNNNVNLIRSMNEQSIKMNSENIGNMVLQFLDEYCRII